MILLVLVPHFTFLDVGCRPNPAARTAKHTIIGPKRPDIARQQIYVQSQYQTAPCQANVCFYRSFEDRSHCDKSLLGRICG
jgi:hypothetical protein